MWLHSTWALNAVLNVKRNKYLMFSSVTLDTHVPRIKKMNESTAKSFLHGAGLLKILLW